MLFLATGVAPYFLSDQKPRLRGLTSGVFKECHEPEIHVQLLVTMKQCVARIVSHKIKLYFLVSTEHYDVLDDAGRWSSRDAHTTPISHKNRKFLRPNLK